jgi:futalosine hydrolase
MTPELLLIVTAVEAEAEAVRAGADPAVARVAAVGVGPAAAAAGTARLLALAEAAGTPYRAVISAGIAGGFPGRAEVGATVLGTRTIAADLGAETDDSHGSSSHGSSSGSSGGGSSSSADNAGSAGSGRLGGFIPVDDLGFGRSVIAADAALLKSLTSALPHAIVGDILTLATVTGTARTAAVLGARHPHAVAEAMEGYGVACAAQTAAVPFLELRTISNPIGPRDRASWRLREAFSALTEATAQACG